jgi:hypothetical protein
MKTHPFFATLIVIGLLVSEAPSGASGAPSGAAGASTGAATTDDSPRERDVVIPAGTRLSVELQSSVASDSSRVEDAVHGRVRRPIVINGVTVVPTGATVLGHVTDAKRSAKVKGLARVAFRFNQLDLPGGGGRVPIRTAVIARQAQPTKKADATKIGGGAAAGAVIGAIAGGGDGAAKGAAIGGAAGTGVVLATRGKEVRLGAGTPVVVRLTQPVTIRVRS